MSSVQAVPSPQGVSVFGSSIVRVEPDVALVRFGVRALEPDPARAFEVVRATSKAVRTFLAGTGIEEVASSRITLGEEHRFVNGERRFLGYLARSSFNVLLGDLEQMEPLLVGIIGAGASEIQGIDYQTTRLREVRAEARRGAFAAARDKALLYCEAAGLELGRVLHIEDSNPQQLSGTGEGHVTRQLPSDEAGPIGAFDPGAVSVGGAVHVVFAVETP